MKYWRGIYISLPFFSLECQSAQTNWNSTHYSTAIQWIIVQLFVLLFLFWKKNILFMVNIACMIWVRASVCVCTRFLTVQFTYAKDFSHRLAIHFLFSSLHSLIPTFTNAIMIIVCMRYFLFFASEEMKNDPNWVCLFFDSADCWCWCCCCSCYFSLFARLNESSLLLMGLARILILWFNWDWRMNFTRCDFFSFLPRKFTFSKCDTITLSEFYCITLCCSIWILP